MVRWLWSFIWFCLFWHECIKKLVTHKVGPSLNDPRDKDKLNPSHMMKPDILEQSWTWNLMIMMIFVSMFLVNQSYHFEFPQCPRNFCCWQIWFIDSIKDFPLKKNKKKKCYHVIFSSKPFVYIIHNIHEIPRKKHYIFNTNIDKVSPHFSPINCSFKLSSFCWLMF